MSMILARELCLRASHGLKGPRGGGGVLSAVHSRWVKAEWTNCVPLLSEKTRNPPISLIMSEEHWLSCLRRTLSAWMVILPSRVPFL